MSKRKARDLVADLELAFVYRCPGCNAENFVRSVIKEFSAEEQIELNEDFDETPQTGDWVTFPDEVTCKHCHATFPADHSPDSPQVDDRSISDEDEI